MRTWNEAACSGEKPGQRAVSQGFMAMSRTRANRLGIAAELVAVYFCILLYIWRWHRPHPLLWIPILAFIIATHVLHGDSLREMGLTLHHVRGSAKIIFPLAAVIYGAVILWAIAAHRLALPWPREAALESAGTHVAWCCFQQYLMQSYFYRRLRTVLRSPHLAAIVAALMFSGAHVPNAVLMLATLAGGFILSEVFGRHANIWPLAIAQAAGGMLIAAVFPASIIHQMRVGPGYYSAPSIRSPAPHSF